MTYPQQPHRRPDPYSAPVLMREAAPPHRPGTVEAAFWIAVVLPLVVTALAALGHLQLQGRMVAELGNAGGFDDAVAQEVAQAVSRAMVAAFAAVTAFYAILTGLWIAFGFKLRAGHNWARVTLTAFAALWGLLSLGWLVSGGLAGSLGPDAHLPGSYYALSHAQSAIGLLGATAFVVLVFLKPSNAYFRAFQHPR